MKLTVNQILHTEGFEKFRVICGNRGLNREVSSVSVIDAPDIYNWLQGGEILLTSGYIFKNNSDIDLAVFENVNREDEYKIRNEIDELDIIYKIDLVFINNNTKMELLKSIEMEGVDF